MQTYLAGYDIPLQVPLADASGVAIVAPTSVSFDVVDENGVEIIALTSLTPTATSTQDVVIPAVSNGLGLDDSNGLRKVRLFVVSAGVTYLVEWSYIIESASPLVSGGNSFQSLEMAELTALNLADIDAWHSSSRTLRISAMRNAFHAIGQLYLQVGDVKYPQITTIGVNDFNLLDWRFLQQIRLAQLVEANEFLAGDTVHKKRMTGLLSETIGESSMFFRPGKMLITPVTRRSMQLLGAYLVWEMRVGRS